MTTREEGHTAYTWVPGGRPPPSQHGLVASPFLMARREKLGTKEKGGGHSNGAPKCLRQVKQGSGGWANERMNWT